MILNHRDIKFTIKFLGKKIYNFKTNSQLIIKNQKKALRKRKAKGNSKNKVLNKQDYKKLKMPKR